MQQRATNSYDQAKAEAFGGYLMNTLNGAATGLMISIGHRTGLFDHLSKSPAATSSEISEKTGLNERYVREWLNSMVTAGIIEYRPLGNAYYLPDEHAAFLTREAVPNNLASSFQFIPILAAVEDEVVECFRKGGGVPYSSYPRFHEVMMEESNTTVVYGLIDSILPLVPGLIEKLRSGITVADIGCGRGRALSLMAKTFPKSTFHGFDFSAEAIADATADAKRHGLTNLHFEVRDAAKMSDRKRFDLITAFDAIHDQAQPRKVLRGIFEALKDDGVFLMQDIRASSHVHKNMDHPMGTYLYSISCLHCMTVSLANDGEGLGAAWGEEQAIELLNEAGFSQVETRTLDHDIINNYYIARPAGH